MKRRKKERKTERKGGRNRERKKRTRWNEGRKEENLRAAVDKIKGENGNVMKKRREESLKEGKQETKEKMKKS